MSGGVDSSVTASVLLEAGHEVIGMTMSLYDASLSERKGRGGTCCSPAEVDLAKRVCDQLGIPHYTVDERDRFEQNVIDDFVREYAAGRTPNPCARCNEHVKFGPLLTRARALGAERMATGHYARVEGGRLLRGVDPGKDQSYFLFAMGRDTLKRVWFPLGDWTKERVRDRAHELSLPNWAAPDSQELCFVPSGDHGEVVQARAKALGVELTTLDPGEIRDEDGKVIGEHRGIHRVTVGQRRGLAVSGTQPRYVLRVLPEERAVVVGSQDALQKRRVEVSDFRRLAPVSDEGTFRGTVQIRHRAKPTAATITVRGAEATIDFDEPVSAVSPGQAAVVYDGDEVVGGGWILRASG
jgi:tRNA-specific 2-thiouridylase